jgi:hypothetical protein
VDLEEHLFWFALSFQMPVDVLGMDEVSGACREKDYAVLKNRFNILLFF